MGGSSYHARLYYYSRIIKNYARSSLTWNGPETRHNEGKEILLGIWKKEDIIRQVVRTKFLASFSAIYISQWFEISQKVSFYLLPADLAMILFDFFGPKTVKWDIFDDF